MKGNEMKRWVWSFVVTALLVSGSELAYWALRSSPVQGNPLEPPVRPVKTIVVREKAFAEHRSFPGLVEPAAEVQLAFRVGGPLVSLELKVGQNVRKGEVIARIDPRDFELNVVRIQAAIAEAHAKLKALKKGARAEDIAALRARLRAAVARRTEAERNLERLKALVSRHAVSLSRYDKALAAAEAAAADVRALKEELKKAQRGARAEEIEAAESSIRRLAADLKFAKNALSDTLLRAPFNGVVSCVLVENHENVKSGAPVVSLLELSRVEVRTAVPEEVVIHRSSITGVTCMLEAYPARRFAARIQEIGRKIDRANQSYPLSVVLVDAENTVIEPGMAATVHLTLQRTDGQGKGVLVPLGSLFGDEEGRSCVWRIDPGTMRVVKTPVQVGAFEAEDARILSGLEDGDRIVTAGARFLREHQKVRILPQRGEGTS